MKSIKIIRPDAPTPTPAPAPVALPDVPYEYFQEPLSVADMGDTLSNLRVIIEYRRADKEIFVRDLTDKFNEPACVTKSKRGLDKCWTAIQAHFSKLTEMNHRDVMNVMTEHGIKYHYWCMVD